MAEFLTLLFLGIGAYYDVKNGELPVFFLFSFMLTGLLMEAVFRYQSIPDILSGVFLGGSFLLLGRLTKEAIGYGDGIGIAVMGILLGGKRTFVVLTGAFFISAIYGIGKLLRGKNGSDTMPFYPFLFAAALGGIFL